MAQIYVILGQQAHHIMTRETIEALAEKLISTTEITLGLVGLKDTVFTAVFALHTKGEADVQVEIRYTAGKDEYDWGHPFDPSVEVQESLAREIKQVFDNFLKNSGVHPMSLSVWCKPYYNSEFKMFEK